MLNKVNFAIAPQFATLKYLVLRVFHELVMQIVYFKRIEETPFEDHQWEVNIGHLQLLDHVCDEVFAVLQRTPQEKLSITFVRRTFLLFLESEYCTTDGVMARVVKSLQVVTS